MPTAGARRTATRRSTPPLEPETHVHEVILDAAGRFAGRLIDQVGHCRQLLGRTAWRGWEDGGAHHPQVDVHEQYLTMLDPLEFTRT